MSEAQMPEREMRTVKISSELTQAEKDAIDQFMYEQGQLVAQGIVDGMCHASRWQRVRQWMLIQWDRITP